MNIKKTLIVTLLASIPIVLTAQKPNAFISGNIKGLKPNTKVYYWQAGADAMDSVKATNGKFRFAIHIPKNEGNLLMIKLGNESSQAYTSVYFIDRGVLNIQGSLSSFNKANVSGSSFAKDWQQYNQTVNSVPATAALSELYAKMPAYFQKNDTVALQEMYQKADSLESIKSNTIKTWVLANKQSPVSAALLNFFIRESFSLNALDSVVKLLPSSAKNNLPGKNLEKYIYTNKLLAIGNVAPDFTQADTLGKPVSLSSFRGKYVLLDFWASWCGPCRAENPRVVAVFEKYKQKNFTILGVSLDNTAKKDAWLKAIHADKLHWTQVSDLKGWKNEVAVSYAVEAIPANFLLDPEGKIVAKNLMGEELEKKLEELIGK